MPENTRKVDQKKKKMSTGKLLATLFLVLRVELVLLVLLDTYVGNLKESSLLKTSQKLMAPMLQWKSWIKKTLISKKQ